LIYDKSRKDIDYDKHKAYELRRMYEFVDLVLFEENGIVIYRCY